VDGYYRIRFDGLALNGQATALLEGGRIHGIKDGGQYDMGGRYRLQDQGSIVEVELDVHVPGGTYDIARARLRPQPEVVTLKFALRSNAPRQALRQTTADGPLTVSFERLHSPAPEKRGLEHL
jgi:hypothetical protein